MEITTDILKTLRDKTGVSVMQCKKALEEAGGDIAQAEVILRKRAGVAADKVAGRELGAGVVGTYVHDQVIGAMVHLSCETDFVARNEEFSTLARDIAMHITAANPKYLDTTDIKQEEIEAATKVFQAEVEGKPEDMKEKILQGKLDAYFKEQVLMNQSFIKDDTKTIRNLIETATQKFGERVIISKFTRCSARA